MKRIFLFITVVLTACSTSRKSDFDLIISNVTLIDGTGTAARQNVNVYIKENKIVAVNTDKIKHAEHVIDGTDKYLIPGLVDAHIHTTDFKNDFRRFIYFGVTSVVVLGGSKTTNEYYAEMRDLAAQDSIPAPRVFHSSPIFSMEGKHPVKTFNSPNWIDGKTIINIHDTAEIESLVKQAAQQPIIGIKLTIEDGPTPPFVERIPQAFINKVVTEAAKYNLPVYAHISDNTELSMALKAGVKIIVHYTGVDLDFENGKALVDSVYKSNISWITTLMLEKSFMYPLYPDWAKQVESFNLFNKEEIKMLSDSASINQAKQYFYLLEHYFGIKDPNLENVIKPYVAEIKTLYENGVNIVLGTDMGNNFIFPGYSLHEEMQLMELGGMAPVDIIKMSTQNAAKMLHKSETHGTIEPGKFADMVLLYKNPLDSIKNTLAINMVIKNGVIQKRIK